MSKRLDLTGKRFGKLIVLSFSHSEKGFTYWNCKCDCGNEKIIRGTYLTSRTKPTKSCGCLIKEVVSNNLPEHRCVTHSMSKTKFYNVWNSMVMRCTNPKSKSYQRYGGRGIQVCERWRNFKNFYDDMFEGYKEGLSIDRINNDGNYYPNNCEWKNRKQQANNRSSNNLLPYKNKEYTLMEASEKFNIPYCTLKRRIYKGWSIEKAIETPLRKDRRRK